jgi:hypothetical protein
MKNFLLKEMEKIKKDLDIDPNKTINLKIDNSFEFEHLFTDKMKLGLCESCYHCLWFKITDIGEITVTIFPKNIKAKNFFLSSRKAFKTDLIETLAHELMHVKQIINSIGETNLNYSQLYQFDPKEIEARNYAANYIRRRGLDKYQKRDRVIRFISFYGLLLVITNIIRNKTIN